MGIMMKKCYKQWFHDWNKWFLDPPYFQARTCKVCGYIQTKVL